MGADIKALRSRIRSVSSTMHLTGAMGLVASSKLCRAVSSMEGARSYASMLKEMLHPLIACPECRRSPWLTRESSAETRIIVVAGDRGLAGGYNANVFRLAEECPHALLIPIGRRACERFGGSVQAAEGFSHDDARALALPLCRDFAAGVYGRLGIIHTRYLSVMARQCELRWLLPLEKNAGESAADLLFEPSPLELLNSAVPEYVAGALFSAVREGFACELAARRVAMDAAEKNARQMIDGLRLEYNRARQSAITQELTEIIAGSEVL